MPKGRRNPKRKVKKDVDETPTPPNEEAPAAPESVASSRRSELFRRMEEARHKQAQAAQHAAKAAEEAAKAAEEAAKAAQEAADLEDQMERASLRSKSSRRSEIRFPLPQINDKPISLPKMSGIATKTVSVHNAPLNLYAARQESRDLPKFGGDPKEYPNFISNFLISTENCQYSHVENIGRLQRCLYGKAKEAVYALLALPDSVPQILNILENRFGRPEFVIGDLLERLKGRPTIGENDFMGIIEFSSELQNYVISVEILDCLDYLVEPTTLRCLVGKLPPSLKVQWGKYVAESVAYPRINEFSAWLAHEAKGLSVIAHSESMGRPGPSKGAQENGEHGKWPEQSSTHTSPTGQGKPRECKFCAKEFHPLEKCEKWIKAPLGDRWDWVHKRRFCFKCLRPFHQTAKCKCSNCSLCNGQHHTSLHKPEQNAGKPSNTHLQPSTSRTVSTPETCGKERFATLLRVLPVTLYGPKGSVDTYAMLDDGSTVTLLEASLAKELGITGELRPLSLAWTGQMVRVEDESEVVRVEISGCPGKETSKKFTLHNVRTVGELHLAPQSFDLEELIKVWPFVAKGAVAPLSHAKPRMIIGQDNWPLLRTRQSYGGPWRGPVVSLTWLGWVLHGNVPQRATSDNFNVGVHQQRSHWEDVQEELDNDLHKLVKSQLLQDNFLVNPPSKKLRSKEDNLAIEIFDKTTKYMPEVKRWETGLLWKASERLPESRTMAELRLRSLEKRFKRDPEFAKSYCAKMEENFTKGYARVLTPQELKLEVPRTWYLPHMGVTNPNKPGKLRICFDASAKSQGFCFNDFIYTGPDLYVSIIGLLMKFRQKPVAVTGDIKEMFPQVRIRAVDQHAQRFLWRGADHSKPPDVCVMQAMLFGSVCSPYAAQEIRNRNAERFREHLPRAVEAITTKHYMDDYCESIATESDAIQLLHEVMDVHKDGGFLLCAITSNSKAVMDTVAPDLRAEPVVKILGLLWDTTSDELGFSHLWERIVGEFRLIEQKGATKRKMLRQVMRIYDPLGMLQNYVVQARILLQELWEKDLHWDDAVPESFVTRWRAWVTQLETIKTLKFPRYYSELAPEADIELHVFCDASEQAYATVAYLRFAKGSEVEVRFVGAKAQVAPTQTVTIPRLELRAAVLASRLAQFCKDTLEFDLSKVTLWSDSKIVLCWIRSRRRKFKSFVANHVSEILDTTKEEQWRWVPTEVNPADQATRWKLDLLSVESKWLMGPDFLRSPEYQWPQETEHKVPDDVLELRPVNCHATRTALVTHPIELPEATRFSTWNRMIGVAGWILRYKTNLQNRAATRNRPVLQINTKLPEPLTCDERNAAELLWCRKVQQDAFREEIVQLGMHGTVDAKSRLAKLDPYLDLDMKVIRIQGRIDAADVPDAVKRPVVLDQHHNFTKLLILEAHKQAFHQGRETVLNELRLRYWVLQGRKTVRDTIKTCRSCRRRKSKAMEVRMGDLPEARFAHHIRPFTNVGLDYFGPMTVTIGRRHEKRWGAIFTCMTTRAVHLELAHSLSTDSAIMAIRRFSARRGTPAKIFSDNGTNFRGADNELQRCLAEWNQNEISTTLAIRGIRWHFNPPGAPHMGGCWERLIRSVKEALKAVLHSKSPREEVLLTLLTEAEGILNSRPLVTVSADSGDREALTPNHFLVGGPSLRPVVPPIPENACLRKAWRVSQQLADKFWTRWVKEYLPTLFKRSDLRERRGKIAVGHTVLIVDPNAERGAWPMGIVEATYPGGDGRTRVVDVRTTNGILRRHVTKLCPLEGMEPT